MSNPFADALRDLVTPFEGKPVIVHSDLFVASRFVDPGTDRQSLLRAHTALLDGLGPDLLVPAFTYGFLKSGVIDLRTAPAELGVLNEYMRLEWAGHRTFDPVFSFLQKSSRPEGPSPADPFIAFGQATAFADVVEKSGALLMYGARLSSMTMLHHFENLAGMPPYRYDKDFKGNVTAWDGTLRSITYRYHVRPLGRHLDYDWPRIAGLLHARGVIQPIDHANVPLALLVPVRPVTDALLDAMKRDPLFLLDAESRAWVEPMLQKLGRRFLLEDFEPDAN